MTTSKTHKYNLRVEQKIDKKNVCFDILRELINLRGVVWETQAVYANYLSAISRSWERGLGSFIDEEFYGNVISAYSSLLRGNCATFASIPLRIQGKRRVAMISSDSMAVTSTPGDKNSTSSLWCGVGRAETHNHTQLVSVPVVKMQDAYTGSDRIVYCAQSHILNDYTLGALVHNLYRGRTDIVSGALSAVSLAFFDASCRLSDYCTKNAIGNDLQLPSTLVDEKIELWLAAMSQSQSVILAIKENENSNPDVYAYNFFRNVEQFYDYAEETIALLPEPESLTNLSCTRGAIRLFNLYIDIDEATRFQAVRGITYVDGGICIRMGDETGSIIGHPARKLDSAFAHGLITMYIVLMTAMSDQGLVDLKESIIEAKRQYLDYINTLSSIQTALAVPILGSLV